MQNTQSNTNNQVDQIIAYENGELDEQDTIELFLGPVPRAWELKTNVLKLGIINLTYSGKLCTIISVRQSARLGDDMQITFEAHGKTYILSTDHSQSSYGVPVLVTESGAQLGPWDAVRYTPSANSAAAGVLWYARAIAALLEVVKPHGSESPYTADPAVLSILRKFESIPGQPGIGCEVAA